MELTVKVLEEIKAAADNATFTRLYLYMVTSVGISSWELNTATPDEDGESIASVFDEGNAKYFRALTPEIVGAMVAEIAALRSAQYMVGDTVRVVKEMTEDDARFVGRFGTIISIVGDGLFSHVVSFGDAVYRMDKSQIERWPNAQHTSKPSGGRDTNAQPDSGTPEAVDAIAVGDVVRVTGGLHKGHTGQVTATDLATVESDGGVRVTCPIDWLEWLQKPETTDVIKRIIPNVRVKYTAVDAVHRSGQRGVIVGSAADYLEIEFEDGLIEGVKRTEIESL